MFTMKHTRQQALANVKSGRFHDTTNQPMELRAIHGSRVGSERQAQPGNPANRQSRKYVRFSEYASAENDSLLDSGRVYCIRFKSNRKYPITEMSRKS
jgi:hypothetical protein